MRFKFIWRIVSFKCYFVAALILIDNIDCVWFTKPLNVQTIFINNKYTLVCIRILSARLKIYVFGIIIIKYYMDKHFTGLPGRILYEVYNQHFILGCSIHMYKNIYMHNWILQWCAKSSHQQHKDKNICYIHWDYAHMCYITSYSFWYICTLYKTYFRTLKNINL